MAGAGISSFVQIVPEKGQCCFSVKQTECLIKAHSIEMGSFFTLLIVTLMY